MRYQNNPANIRYSGFNNWKGLVGKDHGFCVFESKDYGIRALIIILRRYICVYKKKSVQEIISRFAPPFENNTRRYVAYVESVLVKHGYDPNNIAYSSGSFIWLCVSICWFETQSYISYDMILEIKNKFHLN